MKGKPKFCFDGMECTSESECIDCEYWRDKSTGQKEKEKE